MRRFGYKVVLAAFFVSLSVSCSAQRYADDDMARMATVVRTTMSIVKGKYYGTDIPEVISEKTLIEIVRNENSQHFNELDIFDGSIDIMIVGYQRHIGAVVWDSDSGKKLLQDLQCTLKLDDQTWQRDEQGQQFMLDWTICE